MAGAHPGTEYEWYALVSDAEGSRTSDTWQFTTASDYTIVASAGPGGTIAPDGTVHVPAGHDTTFTITPDAGHVIADVLVDGFSVGAVPSYTFYAVDASHTIVASFTANTYTLTVNVNGDGTVTRNPDAPTYAHGTRVELTAVPGTGFDFTGWAGDLTGTANPDTVLMDAAKTVTASFADVAGPAVQVTSPNGTEIVSPYAPAPVTWEASDNVGVTSVDIELSRSGPAGPWETLATGEANDGSFEWTVTGPPATDAYVRVVAHDGAGNQGSDTGDAAFEISDVVSGIEEGPVTEYALGTMAPNPLVGTGRIRYAVPLAGRVTIQVVDVRGRIVASLLDGVRAPGRYVVRWDGSTPGGHAATGVYFMQMQAGGKRITQRVMVVR